MFLVECLACDKGQLWMDQHRLGSGLPVAQTGRPAREGWHCRPFCRVAYTAGRLSGPQHGVVGIASDARAIRNARVDQGSAGQNTLHRQNLCERSAGQPNVVHPCSKRQPSCATEKSHRLSGAAERVSSVASLYQAQNAAILGSEWTFESLRVTTWIIDLNAVSLLRRSDKGTGITNLVNA